MSTHQSIPKPANANKKSDILPVVAPIQSRPFIAQPKIESTLSNEEQLAQMRAKREASERLGSTLITPELVPRKLPPLQPKLTIGQPGDQYEQEADTVARQVVDQINAPPKISAQAPRQVVAHNDKRCEPESIQRKIELEQENKQEEIGFDINKAINESIKQLEKSTQEMVENMTIKVKLLSSNNSSNEMSSEDNEMSSEDKYGTHTYMEWKVPDMDSEVKVNMGVEDVMLYDDIYKLNESNVTIFMQISSEDYKTEAVFKETLLHELTVHAEKFYNYFVLIKNKRERKEAWDKKELEIDLPGGRSEHHTEWLYLQNEKFNKAVFQIAEEEKEKFLKEVVDDMYNSAVKCQEIDLGTMSGETYKDLVTKYFNEGDETIPEVFQKLYQRTQNPFERFNSL